MNGSADIGAKGVKKMFDITGFAKMRPGAFKDKLNDLMAKGKKKDIRKIVLKLKEEVLDYVTTNAKRMSEKSVEFRIEGGQVMPQYRGEVHGISPICGVDVLPDIKEKFKKEGFTLEWAYDRGKLNGKLVFRW